MAAVTEKIRSWLQLSQPRPTTRPTAPRFRPSLSTLEDRTVPSTTISGTIFHDHNNDAREQADEHPGILGITDVVRVNGVPVVDANGQQVQQFSLQLLKTDGTVVAETLPDANGNYSFSNVAPGDYIVQLRAPWWAFSSSGTGHDGSTVELFTPNPSNGIDKDDNGFIANRPDAFVNELESSTTIQTHPFTVKSSTTNLAGTVDFGIWCPGVPPPPSTGGQGLTPGFWKQSQHFKFWTGYSQSQSYESVFGVTLSSKVKSSADTNKDGKVSLLEALQLGGGGEAALLRHSVAALLNAANTNVSYEFSQAEVIAMVQEAFRSKSFEQVKNVFEAENELGGVDLKAI